MPLRRTKSWGVECGKFKAYGHNSITLCFDKPRKFPTLTLQEAGDLLIVLNEALSYARQYDLDDTFLENLRLGKTK